MNIPEEFLNRMKNLLEDEYDEFIDSYNKPKAQGLRVNTLKIAKEEFEKITPFELEERIPWEPNGFYINENKPGKHPYHAAGLYYLQEPSAMSVAGCLGIKPGHKVLDLCAAPGGKSTQAAAYLEGQGILVSNEIDSKRARILSENIERLGVKNAVVTNNSANELEAKFDGFFDRIIVDAPCSGEGMFKKEEAAIENWSIDNVINCSIRQKDILESAAKMLKVDGYMVYSTCTFAMEEDEMVIEDFLESHPEFEIEPLEPKWGISEGKIHGALRLFPHRVKGEGHFVCLLRKNDGEDVKHKMVQTNVSSADLKTYRDFEKENLNITIKGTFYASGSELFSLPDGLCDVKGLKVIRGGLHLGTLKKNRFEPNHSLALALSKEQAIRTVDFDRDSEEIYKYLTGNTVNVDVEDGWCLVTVNGYSIGWGKASRNVLKNHYPKGLRWPNR